MRATRTTRTRIAGLTGAIGLALASMGMLAGCDEGDANGVLGAAIGEERQAAVVDVPGIDELRTALSLTDEQVTSLTPVLETWQATIAERQATREARRAGRPHGPRHSADAPGRGDRIRERMHADQEPPMMSFLAASGRILEPTQMVALAGLLDERHAQRRAEHMAQRGARKGQGRHGAGMGPGAGLGEGPGPGPHAGFGPGSGGPGFGGPALGGAMRIIAHDLGADRATLTAIHDVIREQHEATRPLWDGYHAGTVTAEALRDGLGSARRAVESKLGTLFDADQLATIESYAADARARMAERQLERLDARLDRHAEFLADALDLSEAQAAAVAAAIEGTKPSLRETIEAGGAGTIELEEVLYRTLVLRTETVEAVRAQLTEAQAQVFDALRDLMPRF